jgi:hypothetical protein
MKIAAWLSILPLALAMALSGQTITVTSPGMGTTWQIQETCDIIWATAGNMDERVLILLRSGGNVVMEITMNTENDGTFSWTIPSSVAPGRYSIRIKTLDQAVSDDSETFSIVQP